MEELERELDAEMAGLDVDVPKPKYIPPPVDAREAAFMRGAGLI